jgi:hypothetical protein
MYGESDNSGRGHVRPEEMIFRRLRTVCVGVSWSLLRYPFHANVNGLLSICHQARPLRTGVVAIDFSITAFPMISKGLPKSDLRQPDAASSHQIRLMDHTNCARIRGSVYE